MRLRQLGTTQSVVFFAPPEVHQSILDVRMGRRRHVAIDSVDVIHWLMEQTCRGIEQLQPLYHSQGVDFCKRTQAAHDETEYLTSSDHRAAYIKALAQPEQHSLHDLYFPKPRARRVKASEFANPKIAGYVQELNAIRDNFQDTGAAVNASAVEEVEVEQEREVAVEAEAIREIQKPSHRTPEPHNPVHRDIIRFVETGFLSENSYAYEQAFVNLRRTSVGSKYGVEDEATTSRLFTTTDFSKTVALSRGNKDDLFQRPVEWILWSDRISETALIISPHEAETILPMLRSTSAPCVFLLTYTPPVTRKMLCFNDLNFYTIPSLSEAWKAPRWLVFDVGLFAGRLYFPWEEYLDLCDYLGLSSPKRSNKFDESESIKEGDVIVEKAEALNNESSERSERPFKGRNFTSKPLNFLQEWLAVRRKGQDFTHTPMGYICQGKELSKNHPFFRQVTQSSDKGEGLSIRDHENGDDAAAAKGLLRAKHAYEDLSDDEEYADGDPYLGIGASEDEGGEGEDARIDRALGGADEHLEAENLFEGIAEDESDGEN